MAAPPDTPPATPDPRKAPGPNPANVDGDVNFRDAEIKNSIATGHIHGYEVILATINVTVDSANKLTENIEDFMAQVDVHLNLVSAKVGSAASVLTRINELVAKQARKQGLVVDKGVKVPKNIQNEQTTRGNVTGNAAKTDEETKQKWDASREITSMTCFEAIIERTEGAQKAFEDISKKISDALKAVGLLKKLHQDGQEPATGIHVRGLAPDAPAAQRPPSGHPATQRGKIELTDEDRRTVLLTEKDLVWMEKRIEIQERDLYHRFIFFEYALADERNDKEEENVDHIKRELERVKMVGKNIWKEIKMLARYLFRNDRPTELLDDVPLPRPRTPPEIVRRHLPDPSRMVSLYAGWEFRKTLPQPPQFALKPSWSFAKATKMPFSTEELFLRVVAQVTQRAKSERTLVDDYWGVLKRARQRMLVSTLLKTENHHLWNDFPQLEWTIAGLGTRKDDPWAVLSARSRSDSRRKKKKNRITTIEVILKTQWRISRGPMPPMPPPPWSHGGPTPVPPPGLGLGLGPLPGPGGRFPPPGHGGRFPPPGHGGRFPPPGHGGRFPPDGYPPPGPWDKPPFPPGGGGGGTGAPFVVDAKPGRHGWPPVVPGQFPPQPPPPKPARATHKSTRVIREPKWVLVKAEEKKTKRRKDEAHDNKGKGDRKRKKDVYAELREPGIYSLPSTAGPSGIGPSSLPPPGMSYRPPPARSVQIPPPPGFSGGYGAPDVGSWRGKIPPAPTIVRPPLPAQTQAHMSRLQTPLQSDEEEEEEEEAEEVVEEILDEFEELTDPKGKKKSTRTRRTRRNTRIPAPMGRPPPLARPPGMGIPMSVAEAKRRMEMRGGSEGVAAPSVSISRSLMRQVEQASSRRLNEEGKALHSRSIQLEQMAEKKAARPPAIVVPGPSDRARLAEEYKPRKSHGEDASLMGWSDDGLKREVEKQRRQRHREPAVPYTGYMEAGGGREAKERRHRQIIIENPPLQSSRYAERQPPPPPPPPLVIRQVPPSRRAYVEDSIDEHRQENVRYQEAGPSRNSSDYEEDSDEDEYGEDSDDEVVGIRRRE